MSDEPKAGPTPASTSAPKKSFFKKSSWRTTVKAEGDKQDIFSHSSDYANIVAEKARRQKEEEEERKKEEEAKKKKAEVKSERVGDEDHDRKRRKVSAELGTSPKSASRASSGIVKGEDRKRINSSLSPHAKHGPSDTLSSRYVSMTRSGSSVTPSKRRTQIIELDDPSDDDDALSPENPTAISPTPQKRIPSPDSDIEDPDSDPELAALISRVRARRLADRTAPELTPITSSSTPTPSKETEKKPIVQLLIESDIPNTRPLLIKIRISDTLRKPRVAWCQKHGFPDSFADNIFLTWRGERVWDSTSIARLGVSVDAMGYISVKGDDNIYMDDEPPKIHLQAWTPEFFNEWKREEEAAAAEAARLKAAASMTQYEEDELEETQPVEKKIGLVLKARGLDDLKIKVKPSTTFEHLASAYRTARSIAPGTAISLFFDGDRLKPMDVVADSEIEDMDSVEVHFN